MGDMQPKSDAQLLREYAESGSESAFTELVTRHTDLVYSAALRQVLSSDLACDVAQNVFTSLARGARTLAGKLNPDASLAGWLCRCTRNQALNLRRDDFRRHSRERQAMENLHPSPETAPEWDRLCPILDEAISGLNEADHDALVLRYFKNQDLCSVGLALGVSDDTAQKRVARALEKLREYLAHHGITTTGAALALAISANAVQAAPVGLAVTISTAAVLAGTTFATTTTATAIKTIAMTTLQKTIITAALATAVGTGIFEAHQASQLRDQLQTLQKQQAPLTEQLAQLQAENKQLSNLVAQAKDQKSLSQAQFNELLKLRGQTGQTRTALQELAKLKSSAAQQSGTIPAFLTNAMAQGMSMAEKSNKKVALAKLDRMKEKLHLTDDQAQAISDIMVKNIENSSQQVLNAMQGKQQMPPQDQATLSALQNEEAAIKALLTPDQLAVYPDFKQAETITSAKNSAQADLTMMTSEMDLSQEQQDKVNSALYQLNLDQASALQKNQEAIAQARATGKFPDFFHLQIETQKQTLENKLKALDGILTPEQLKTYEQKQLDMIDMQTSAMKMFLPQTTNGVAQ